MCLVTAIKFARNTCFGGFLSYADILLARHALLQTNVLRRGYCFGGTANVNERRVKMLDSDGNVGLSTNCKDIFVLTTVLLSCVLILRLGFKLKPLVSARSTSGV